MQLSLEENNALEYRKPRKKFSAGFKKTMKFGSNHNKVKRRNWK